MDLETAPPPAAARTDGAGRRRARGPLARWGACLLLSVGALGASLVIGELILRATMFRAQRFYVWPPHLRKTLHPLTAVLPGVEGVAHFTTNGDGLRGDELGAGQTYRILALGGSTTECLYLDDAEAWPALLQQRLTAAGRGKIWVGNAGSSGKSARHHALQVRCLLPQCPALDALLLLAGGNDLIYALGEAHAPGEPWDDAPESQTMREAFALFPIGTGPWSHENTAIWNLLRKAKNAWWGPVMAATGEHYTAWRSHRRMASAILEELPDLTDALRAYRRRLEAVLDTARAAAVRPILLTQPTLWHAGMVAEDEGLLWMGGGTARVQGEAGAPYYSPAALERAMQAFNATLLEACRDLGVECIDLAGGVPKDTSAFYDDMHFNEGGARLVARLIGEYLMAQAPFVASPAAGSDDG